MGVSLRQNAGCFLLYSMSNLFIDDADICYDLGLLDHCNDPASILYVEQPVLDMSILDTFFADDYIMVLPERYAFDWRKEGF